MTTCAAVILIVEALFRLAASPGLSAGPNCPIMYVHVPSAWMAMFAYAFIVVASAVGPIWKHPIAHVGALAAAPIGACFTLICLARARFG